MKKRKEDYSIIFFGTPEFAVESLKVIHNSGFHIAAVVTVADKKAGRGRKLRKSDVKKYAIENNLKILQPTNLKAPEFINELTALRPDIQIVVAFRMLPNVVIDIPKDGTVNLHASLLPQYRGAAPINHAIIQGEKETGVTTFFIDSKIDTGEILSRQKVKIDDDDTAGKLHDKLMYAGADLLESTIENIMNGKAESIPQANLTPSEELMKAPKINKDFCYINFNQTVDRVYNFIRGLTPYPASRFVFLHKSDGKQVVCQVTSAKAEYSEHNYSPKDMISDKKKHLKIAVPKGFLILQNIKPEGKKAMDIASFLNGFPIDDYFIE